MKRKPAPVPQPAADAVRDQEIRLAEILEIPTLQSILDDFTSLEKVAIGIIDLQGQVLVASGWQDICTKFHRVHPETCRRCRDSDRHLSVGATPGKIKLYRCQNGMWDGAAPILIGPRHFGNLFVGQFFFDDEPPEEEAFRNQARSYGFDEKEYLDALARVPRISRSRIDPIFSFCSQVAGLISSLGFRNLQLQQALLHQQQIQSESSRQQILLDTIIESSHEAIFAKDADGRYLSINQAGAELLGRSPAEVLGRTDSELLPPALAAEFRLSDAEVMQTGRPSMRDEEVRLAGHRRTLLAHKVPWRNSAGEIVGIVGIATDITDRKKMELALQQSEERYRSILNASPDDITIADLDGRIRMVSPSAVKMFAYKRPENMLGRPVADFVVPEDREKARDKLAGMFQTNGPATGEFRGLRADGTRLDIEVNGEFIRDPDGRPRQLLFVVRDISARKRADERLQASAERFQDIAANIPGVIYQLQTGRTGLLEVPYMSSGCEALFGRPPAGMNFTGLLFDSMHVGDRALFEHSIATAATKLADWSLEFRMATPAGKTKWLRGSAHPRQTPAGGILWTGVLLDITELKHAEDALREREAFQILLMDTIPSPVFYKDRQGRYMGFNKAFEKLYGRTKAQLIGKTVRDLVPPQLAEIYESKDAELYRQPGTQVYEAPFVDTAGKPLTVVFHKASVVDAHGSQVGLIGIILDITNRKQAEEQMAQQLDELRRWYAATLGREERVAELKREVNVLAVRLGEPPPYSTGEEPQA